MTTESAPTAAAASAATLSLERCIQVFDDALAPDFCAQMVRSRPRIEDLRIKRYRAGADEKFEPHFDSMDDKANRYLVFLWYLNDVAEGGETEFLNLDRRVAARTGRLLMFPPYWMFQHAGLAPRSNDKYIVSTYLLF